ncbi:MAG: Bax inhibitor-1/YccA family protein, partial [Propionibacteriaceae bacterium]|nr:Bax inhibitor-1/YccA family protein [Propionibacteriaceae bacterium]
AFTPAHNPYAVNNPYAAAPNYQGGYNPYTLPTTAYTAPSTTGLMTYDSVIQKTAAILLVLAAVAYGSVQLLPATLLLPVGLVCGLITIIFPLVAVFRRTMGAPLAFSYAVFEGVFIGAFSMIFERYYPGIIVQAILGTFVATALVLAAFHFVGIRTSSKISRIIRLCLLGYVGVALFSLIASLFGFNTGMFPGPFGDVNGLAWLAALVGVTLAVVSLVDDFTYIERGVQMGAPASQGWTAAWGLSVTLVWLYTQLVRIISYFRR